MKPYECHVENKNYKQSKMKCCYIYINWCYQLKKIGIKISKKWIDLHYNHLLKKWNVNFKNILANIFNLKHTYSSEHWNWTFIIILKVKLTRLHYFVQC